MKRNLKILLIVLISAFGCKENNKSKNQALHNIKIPSISSLNIENKEKLSSVVDSSFITRLETKPECLISSIDKMIMYNNRIYILDKKNSNGVFEFTKRGKFIRKIGKKGKGPGEYTNLKGFTINKNEIILFDWSKRRLLAYSLNGDFIGSKKIGFYLNDFTMEGENYVLDIHNRIKSASDKDKSFSIAMLDKKTKFLSEFLNSTVTINGYGSSKNMCTDKNRIFFKEPYTNIIYEIKNGNYLPLFKLDFQNMTIPENLKKDNAGFSSFRNELSNHKYMFMSNASGYQVIDDYLLFSVEYGNNIMSHIYSITKEKLYPINFSYNDSDYLGLIGQTIGSNKGFVVSYVQPEWILPMKKHIKSEKLKDFLENTEPTDNPILIFNHIRDDL